MTRRLTAKPVPGLSGLGESAGTPGPPPDVMDARGPNLQPESGPGMTLVMIPTGGTTGRIRFAVHTTATLATAAAGLQQWLGGGPVNSVCLLPLDHVSGLMQVVRAWQSGGRLALAAWAEVEAGRFPELPAEPAVTSLVPTQLARLLASPAAVAWLRRFRAIFLGGAAPWPGLLAAARAARLPLALCYGSTETAAQVAAQRPEDFLAGAPAAVEALPHAVVDIVAGDGRSVLPAGEEGRIRVRSEALFLGYWTDPALEHWRWGHLTGDRGTLDPAGRLVVRGRADDQINTGGEKVDPAEVEAAIRETGLVDDVAVCGVPDTDWGEVVVAVIAGGGPGAGAELPERLRGRLAGYKVPKRIVRVSSLNRSASGKLDRRALTRLAGGEMLPP